MYAEIESKQRELAALIERFSGVDGYHSTSIASLDLIRASGPSEQTVMIYEPSLCIIAQGCKQVWLGNTSHIYSPSHYLLVSVDLPITGQVIEATASNPYLAIRIGIDPLQVGEILTQGRLPALDEGIVSEQGRLGNALAVSPLAPTLLDSVIRVMHLLESPHDVPVMFPLLTREILYRLLTGAQGNQLRQIAVSNSQTHRIALAIDWLKRNYTHSIRIEDVARVAHMSPSGFHHHFKTVTAMTPLQYQKQLRLQEARRLMLSEDVDAATVSHRVGYESASQFSREYSRLFGAPPLRDITRLRGSLAIY